MALLAPLRPLKQHYRIEEFEGALNRDPIMPRDAFLSDRADVIFCSEGQDHSDRECFHARHNGDQLRPPQTPRYHIAHDVRWVSGEESYIRSYDAERR